SASSGAPAATSGVASRGQTTKSAGYSWLQLVQRRVSGLSATAAAISRVEIRAAGDAPGDGASPTLGAPPCGAAGGSAGGAAGARALPGIGVGVGAKGSPTRGGGTAAATGGLAA